MALKKYVGQHYEGIELVVHGESFGYLKPGESVVVPDELADTVAWPDELWEDETKKPKAAEKKGVDD